MKGTTAALMGLWIVLSAGCATCREHPVMCTAATVIVAGAVAAAAVSLSDHHDAANQGYGAARPGCGRGPC